jgi:hypothetical protein
MTYELENKMISQVMESSGIYRLCIEINVLFIRFLLLSMAIDLTNYVDNILFKCGPLVGISQIIFYRLHYVNAMIIIPCPLVYLKINSAHNLFVAFLFGLESLWLSRRGHANLKFS